jgi:hypothetical protein
MQTYSLVLQMPGNKADAVPCERLRKVYGAWLGIEDLGRVGLLTINGNSALLKRACGRSCFRDQERSGLPARHQPSLPGARR